MTENIEMEAISSIIEKPTRKQFYVSYLTYTPIFRGITIILGILIILIIIYAVFYDLLPITGIFATAFVTYSLLIIKGGIDAKNLEKKLYAGFIREMGLNISILRYNIKALESYIDILNTVNCNLIYVTPIYRMNFEFWDLIKLNIAEIDFIKDYAKIEQVIVPAHLTNENINAMNKLSSISMIESVIVNQLTEVNEKSKLNFVDNYKDYCNQMLGSFNKEIPSLYDALESFGVIALWDIESIEDLEESLKSRGKKIPTIEMEQRESIDSILKNRVVLIKYS